MTEPKDLGTKACDANVKDSMKSDSFSIKHPRTYRGMRSLAIVSPLIVGVAVSVLMTTTHALAAKPTKPLPSLAPSSKPSGAPTVLFRASYQGGYTRAGTDQRSVPTMVLTTDGRLFRPGVTTQQFPGPAIHPVTITKLTATDLTTVTKLAGAAKLTTKLDLGMPPTADVPELSLNYKGFTNVVASAGVGESSLSPTQQANRKSIRTLTEFLASRPGEKLYPPESVWIGVVRYDDSNVDLSVKQNPQAWPPEAFDLREMGGCKVVVGAQAKAAVAALARANDQTPFTSSGYTYTVLARPMLPGDPGCGSSK